MLRHPLRRDPLFVGWAFLVAIGAVVALDSNTTWSGHVEADRVGGFVADTLLAVLVSGMLLWLAAWFRLWLQHRVPGGKPRPHAPFTALPWTDNWLREGRQDAVAAADAARPAIGHCRHGGHLGESSDQRPPVVRALSVSHTIVRPGSRVSVTWCFQGAGDVVVDGVPGHPACGETTVFVDVTRRVELTAFGRRGRTDVATPTVVAVQVPEVDLGSAAAPPPVALHADVGVSLGAARPVTATLDAFFGAQQEIRGPVGRPAAVVGVPRVVLQAWSRRGGDR
ncbi:hypothetical protein [Klenkia brasiliensis]|uniref:Uncharacterized protein n=1 Tax=Klenkia brasiliensis TaxID=333142 RepID=A0A1G8A1Y2_9ACTN|nr:hypothetical protein [Klenkia brasiliensis]SDH14837.1 hypothetical protein SAMN05660324_0017 [Klenkia brasiliensis]